MTSPMRSSGRSSSFLNRTHDLPMSSFFPLAAYRSSNHPMSSLCVYRHIRYSAMWFFWSASEAYISGCPLYVLGHASSGTT